MSTQDRGPRILAWAIALTIVGMIFAFNYARAATFNERFSAAVEDPKAAEPVPTPWHIKLLLIIDGAVKRSVDYNDAAFATGEECKDAVMSNLKLQTDAQTVAKAVGEQLGESAAIAVVCSMRLD